MTSKTQTFHNLKATEIWQFSNYILINVLDCIDTEVESEILAKITHDSSFKIRPMIKTLTVLYTDKTVRENMGGTNILLL